MKKNLLDYLEEDKKAEAEEPKEEGGESLEDMKALLLLMKADSVHDQMGRAKAFLAAIKCVCGKGGDDAEDSEEE